MLLRDEKDEKFPRWTLLPVFMEQVQRQEWG